MMMLNFTDALSKACFILKHTGLSPCVSTCNDSGYKISLQLMNLMKH